MTATIPVIELQAAGPKPVVVEGPGWVQTTPAGRGERTYRETALGDDRWPATDITFTSLTAVLAKGIPADWTGPAKWNVARYADTHWDELGLDAVHRDHGTRVAELCGQGMTLEEACRYIRVGLMVDAAQSSLEAAADRGSAIHRAMEALLQGVPVDRDDLRTHGALPYLLAVERFVTEAQPVAHLLEAVCFDRELQVAGTVDFVGTIEGLDGLLVLDWKTRSTADHDRRQKEAAQVAGYAHMLREHYYLDGRGVRRQQPVAGAAVVTFAPDGTWAIHPVPLDAGIAHYRRAVEVARENLVSRLYDTAIKSDAPDVNAIALERLAGIPDGTPERAALASTWGQLGLGAASRGELTIEDWPVVDDLLAVAEGRFRPFPGERIAPTVYAGAGEIAAVQAELDALPPDLRGRLFEANGPLFRRWGSGVATAEDLEDVERLLGSVAEAAACRAEAVRAVLASVAERSELERQLLLDGAPAEPRAWTEADVERVAALWGALDAGHLVVRDGALTPSVRAAEDLAAAGKRDACTAARPFAQLFGRPHPRKWDDLVADPVLFAAVVAA